MKLFNFDFFGFNFEFIVNRFSKKKREEIFKKNNVYFSGNYESWSLASSYALGYGDQQILNQALSSTRVILNRKAAYERDTVLFEKAQPNYPLLTWLLYTAHQNDGRLSVMDFGGSFGSSYFQNRGFISNIKLINWGVVEQQHFVSAGKEEFETNELRFFYNQEECIQYINPNFLLLSSVLQYLETPYYWLDKLLSLNIDNVLIDRTMARHDERDQISIQYVPKRIYLASYPVWFLSAEKIESLSLKHGYEIIDCFDPCVGSLFGTVQLQWPYLGWYLKKITT
jgi:putative methyltransferase (TIGR04325 family)